MSDQKQAHAAVLLELERFERAEAAIDTLMHELDHARRTKEECMGAVIEALRAVEGDAPKARDRIVVGTQGKCLLVTRWASGYVSGFTVEQYPVIGGEG